MRIFIKGISEIYSKNIIKNSSKDIQAYTNSGNLKISYQNNEMLLLEMPSGNEFDISRNEYGDTTILISNKYLLNVVMLNIPSKAIKAIEMRLE